jgi:nucleoside-diphosphate-sugar epimerase
MIYVLGGGGFVGQAFVRLFERQNRAHRVITRSNYEELRGSACDVLINAAGNSKKFLANREPLRDFDETVRLTADSLLAFPSKTYVLLSSGDVYPDQSWPSVTREDQEIDPARQSRYGLHKSMAENLVRGAHPGWLVLRMGGFVGPGLKKNAIYDMLRGDPVWLSPQSELQYLSTDSGAAFVWRLIERGVRNEIVNLGARGVVGLAAVHKALASQSRFQPDAPTVRYELNLEKLTRHAGEAPPLSADEVSAFLQERANASGAMLRKAT